MNQLRSVVVAVFCVALLAACQSSPSAPGAAPPPKPAAPPAELIKALDVVDASTAKNWSVQPYLDKDSQFYGDRSFMVSALPEKYVGLDWIRVACDAKNFTGAELVSFTITADSVVYLAYDDRVVKKPAWLEGWTDTGEELALTGSPPVTMSLFAKEFGAGSLVKLGPNGQSGGCIQYGVLVQGPGPKKAKPIPVAGPVTYPPATYKSATTMPEGWYKTPEAFRIGDNFLLYQRNTGGFPKNLDMAKVLTPADVTRLQSEKALTNDSTIDNNATIYEITYLARLGSLSGERRFQEGALRGIDYLLAAQFPNGGWPQYFPLGDPAEYYFDITYNDNAMINVLNLLTQIQKNDPIYSFVDSVRRSRVKGALDKGLECILKTQVVIGGVPTVWCAQHDPDTLAPSKARAYELPSLSGSESVGIVQYLMELNNPSPEVVKAVQGAVAWFQSSRIDGVRLVQKVDPSQPNGKDLVVESDPAAPPVWGRFYDLETGKAFFVGRDSVKKATLAEIEHERRTGYSYYTYAPAFLLDKLYPVWQAKFAPGVNVLKK